MPRAKTPEEWDISQQMQAHYAEERAKAQAAQAEQERQMDANRRARENALANGGTPPAPTIPTWQELGAQWQAERIAAKAAAEQARIAAITPRQIWMSQLTWSQQERVRKWEAINPGLEWNMSVQP